MLKKLKSVFILEDENVVKNSNATDDLSPDKTNESTSTKTSNSSVSYNSNEVAFETTPIDGSTPDPKFVEILLKAIEENNLEGFDYLEYKSSLQSLSKMNMDDATKYQSAMAMAKTMGANKNKVIQSANHYLLILSKENDKFQAAVSAQKSKITQDQESGIKNIELSIANKRKQIEQLNKEIEIDTKKLEDMRHNINSSTSKISETTSKFNYAYKIVSQQIADDMKNISSYIPNE